MFAFTALFLSGIVCVRLSSSALTRWDPFDLISVFSALESIDIDDPQNKYNDLYFPFMCNFFSSAFGITYVALYVPTATAPKPYQTFMNSSWTILSMLALHAMFSCGRYCYKAVLIASVFGAFWAIVMVNFKNWMGRCLKTEPMRKLIQCCMKCGKKREEQYNLNPAARPLTREDVFVL